MEDDFAKVRFLTGTVFAQYTFEDVQEEDGNGEYIGVVRFTFPGPGFDETAVVVEEQAHVEGDEQVMGVPKEFELLLSHLDLGRGVHEEHDDEHDMTGRTAESQIMNHPSPQFQYVEQSVFDNKEVVVMSVDVHESEKQHGIRGTFVEEDVLVEGDDAVYCRSPDHADQVSAHWEKEESAVYGKNQTGTTGRPDGETD